MSRLVVKKYPLPPSSPSRLGGKKNNPLPNGNGLFLELLAGLEPATCWLRISCSTDWATVASVAIYLSTTAYSLYLIAKKKASVLHHVFLFFYGKIKNYWRIIKKRSYHSFQDRANRILFPQRRPFHRLFLQLPSKNPYRLHEWEWAKRRKIKQRAGRCAPSWLPKCAGRGGLVNFLSRAFLRFAKGFAAQSCGFSKSYILRKSAFPPTFGAGAPLFSMRFPNPRCNRTWLRSPRRNGIRRRISPRCRAYLPVGLANPLERNREDFARRKRPVVCLREWRS